MTEQTRIRFSLRKKLFTLVLIGFTTMIVATSWRIGQQADTVADTARGKSLSQSSLAINTKIDSRFASVKEVATGIAKDSRVLPLVFDAESLTLQDLSLEFQRIMAFDILFFTDAEGTVLARSDRPEAIGRNMSGRSSLFDVALEGEVARGIIVSKGKLLQTVVVPIFDNVVSDLVRGTVALSYAISGDLAKEIQALTASDIGLFVFTRDKSRVIDGVKSSFNTRADLTSSLESYFRQTPSAWRMIEKADQDASDLTVNLNGEDYFAAVHRLVNSDGNSMGFVMALRSRSELLKPFLDIQRSVIVIGFLCLIGASVFAWLFSTSISRPIIRLVSVARAIQDGDYPEKKALSVANDEVGVLRNAIISMGNTLREKAELESYLAQLADEIDISESISQAAADATFDPVGGDNTFMLPESDESPQLSSKSGATQFDGTDATVTLAHTVSLDVGRAIVAVDAVVDERYKIIRSVGSGAMGEVYLAHDLELDEKVAIKMMAKLLFSQQESLNVKEEIRLARRITHRNILRTFDFGSWNEYYYITMEYMPGHDLGQLLKSKGAFDTQIGLLMAKQICSAIHAAHEQGIIHRDLKPANMMINRQGILKIMDFGLAMKVVKNARDEADNTNTSGVIAGTPKYMAPEQFFAWTLDERTDIYAIGVILHTIFSGEPPFNFNDIKVLADHHLSHAPPEIEGKSGAFPPNLQNIIRVAMAKKPEDRYQSARSLLDDLNAL
ncbi:MAG: hypothetical protein COA42_03240 [Alteromonadaceae bacterium]|nr:MAG: hypothetical protein COA42_03240 [Alteromonadaceae bacterium]